MTGALKMVLTAALLILFAGPAQAATDTIAAAPKAAPAAGAEAERIAKARAYFTDLPLVAHDGRQLRFFSDVLADKVVLIYLFYTGCAQACPLINAKLAEVQDRLGEGMGRDFALVSLSVDPGKDSPEVLKKYAAGFGAREGWYFLTGNRDDVATVARKLGHTNPDPAAHTMFLNVGNVNAAKWIKMRPDSSAEAIALQMKSLREGPAR